MCGSSYISYINDFHVHICMYNYHKEKKFASKVAFIDPQITSQSFMDEYERKVEDYILTVIEKSLNKDLILWPFHKKYAYSSCQIFFYALC